MIDKINNIIAKNKDIISKAKILLGFNSILDRKIFKYNKLNNEDIISIVNTLRERINNKRIDIIDKIITIKNYNTSLKIILDDSSEFNGIENYLSEDQLNDIIKDCNDIYSDLQLYHMEIDNIQDCILFLFELDKEINE